jgi:hypothetical protein
MLIETVLFKRKSVTVGVPIVVAVVVAPIAPDCPLVAIVSLDVLLFDVTVFAMSASAVVGDIQTNEFLEGIGSEPSSVIKIIEKGQRLKG